MDLPIIPGIPGDRDEPLKLFQLFSSFFWQIPAGFAFVPEPGSIRRLLQRDGASGALPEFLGRAGRDFLGKFGRKGWKTEGMGSNPYPREFQGIPRNPRESRPHILGKGIPHPCSCYPTGMAIPKKLLPEHSRPSSGPGKGGKCWRSHPWRSRPWNRSQNLWNGLGVASEAPG